MTTNAYLWGPHWDSATQRRVNQVGAKCKKCGTEEWTSAPGPGWGRRVFKKRGWHLGNTANSHTCPKCIAKKHAPKKTGEALVLHPQSERVDAAPIRPIAMDTTAMLTQGRHFETRTDEQIGSQEGGPFNTALAEKLAPVREKFEAKARKVKSRGQPDGFSQRSSAAAAARRFLVDKLKVAKPLEDVHYRTVKDPKDGTYAYVLIAHNLPPLPAEALKPPAPEPKVKTPRVKAPRRFNKRGAPPLEPGVIRRAGPARLRGSAVGYCRRGLNIESPVENVDYHLVEHGRGDWSYELGPKPPPVAAAPLTPSSARDLPAVVENPPVVARHRQRYTGTRPDRANPPDMRLARTSPPEALRDTHRSNIRKSAMRYLALTAGNSDAKEGVDFETFKDPVTGFHGYRLLQPNPDPNPEMTLLGPAGHPVQESIMSDASTQAVRDAEEAEAARAPKPPGREMTYADKRRVREAVEEFYDDEGGHYKGDWSDKTLAEKLNVARIWVTQVRELYGPDKNDAERLRQEAELMAARIKIKRLESLVDEAKKIVDAVMDLGGKLENKMAEVEALKKEFGL